MARSDQPVIEKNSEIKESSPDQVESKIDADRHSDSVDNSTCIEKTSRKKNSACSDHCSETENTSENQSDNKPSTEFKPAIKNPDSNNSNLEVLIQLLTKFFELTGFKNQKTQKIIQNLEEIYNVLVAINSSNSSECQTFELFPILITLTENLVVIEFFLCEQKRPLIINPELKPKVEDMMKIFNEKYQTFQYEIKPKKDCVVFKTTFVPDVKFDQFFLSGILERFCQGLRIFSETVEIFYKILKNQDFGYEQKLKNYKIPTTIDRVFISDLETVDCIYPFHYKSVNLCKELFETEKTLLLELKKERKEFFWYVIDDDNQTIHYPIFGDMKPLDEVTGLNKVNGIIQSVSEPTSVNQVLVCFDFFYKLLEKKIFLSDFFSMFFIVEERGKAMVLINQPISKAIENTHQGSEMVEFIRMGFLNLLGKINFAEVHAMNIYDQLENVNFETRTAEVLGDRVELIEMTPEFQINETDILYGYILRDGKAYLVIRS